MDQNRYFFIASVLTFQKLMIVFGQISCIFLHANEGHESKTRDSVYNAHLNFRSFFSRKKVRIIHG